MSRPIRCSCQTKDKCCRLGHIFSYFIQHPDVYTQQQWKSLDAYKYFRSEHVCCCFLMGESKLVWQIAQNCEAVSRPIQCSCQTKDLDCKCCRLGQIFRYFIQHPDVYTQQQLVQWKSLDGYKYFRRGHVHEVSVGITSKTCCFLMAYMNPSQSSPDRTGRLSLPTAPVPVCLGKSNQVQSVPSSLVV